MRRATPLLALALLSLAADDPSKPAADRRPRLMVPAYFYPEGKGRDAWDRLFRASKTAEVAAIVNPASGPGRRVDPAYVEVVRRGKAEGVTLVGYVSTDYARRPIAEVKADVDRWVEFYPGIDGIFLDEQASSAEKVDYYAELYEYARKSKGLTLVVTNPGTSCDEAYLARPAADVVCLFENARGVEGLDRLPDFLGKYAPERVYTLHHTIDSADAMRAILDAASERGVGWTYVTDDVMRNPWDKLPSYWDEEVAGARPRAEVGR